MNLLNLLFIENIRYEKRSVDGGIGEVTLD